MKNINNKKMISVNEDILNSALTLFLFFMSDYGFSYAGSCSKSINSTVEASILKTTFSTLATRRLYPTNAMIPIKSPNAVVINA